MQQLLSATINVLLIVSFVYFTGGLILSIRSKWKNPKKVRYDWDIKFSQAVAEMRQEIDPVKPIPTDRKSLVRLCLDLGIKNAQTTKTIALVDTLKTQYKYN